MKTHIILEPKSKGRIKMSTTKNSRLIQVEVYLDGYGFSTKIIKKDLEELLK